MLYSQHILVCEHVTPGILWKGKTSSGKFATFRGGERGSKKMTKWNYLLDLPCL
jgi:hypothetical protein